MEYKEFIHEAAQMAIDRDIKAKSEAAWFERWFNVYKSAEGTDKTFAQAYKDFGNETLKIIRPDLFEELCK